MKRNIFFLVVLFLGLMSQMELEADNQTDQLYTRRFAFFVGANDGGKDRVILRYAVDDARAIQKVLEEMGGVLPGDSRFLAEPNREAFFKEIGVLAKDVEQARKKFRRVEMIFYYSGHSDENSIFLGNDRITYKEFKDFITSMNADVRIAIIDSCASGNITLPKGVIKESPFLLDTAFDMKGYAFMTSSSASEAAQESGRLKRSYFTHNLISGMRGAADMNLDGRITLNEAYQFAFDGTLKQTEKTMAGPQHPSYHIQMSGTGDVVITEIWKSQAVLVLKKDITGKVYIHNQDDVLVVELRKSAGREISIGLSAGTYRLINIGRSAIFESKIALEDGKSRELGQEQFKQTDKIPTRLRGNQIQFFPEPYMKREPGRWRIEIFGGFATMNPADLNMRATHDGLRDAFFIDDYLRYQKNQGEIVYFVKNNEGGTARLIENAIPVGIRLRYGITRWLDLSLGFTHISGSRTSSFTNRYEVIESGGIRSIYTDNYSNYTLTAKGYIPSLGIHLGKKITPSLRLETFLIGGPVFAECKYSLTYNLDWVAALEEGDFDNPNKGLLEEKGIGIGLSLHAGVKLDIHFQKHFGFFTEGGYAFQTVSSVSGPGTRSETSNRDSWEGEWGIKQDTKQMPWGTARFLWPSNSWEEFGETWSRLRNFKLDLSGFQAKTGIFFRF